MISVWESESALNRFPASQLPMDGAERADDFESGRNSMDAETRFLKGHKHNRTVFADCSLIHVNCPWTACPAFGLVST